MVTCSFQHDFLSICVPKSFTEDDSAIDFLSYIIYGDSKMWVVSTGSSSSFETVKFQENFMHTIISKLSSNGDCVLRST